VRDSGQISRAEAVHDPQRGRTQRRYSWRIGNRHAPWHHDPLEERIDQDDDDAAMGQVVANDIRRNGRGAGWRSGGERRQLNSLEGNNRPRLGRSRAP
jgi:hypothetical protein